MLEITIYDEDFKQEMTGEFESEEECRDWYAMELGCQPEDIKIIKVKGKEEV